jgi:hypothetical protein
MTVDSLSLEKSTYIRTLLNPDGVGMSCVHTNELVVRGFIFRYYSIDLIGMVANA